MTLSVIQKRNFLMKELKYLEIKINEEKYNIDKLLYKRKIIKNYLKNLDIKEKLDFKVHTNLIISLNCV